MYASCLLWKKEAYSVVPTIPTNSHATDPDDSNVCCNNPTCGHFEQQIFIYHNTPSVIYLWICKLPYRTIFRRTKLFGGQNFRHQSRFSALFRHLVEISALLSAENVYPSNFCSEFYLTIIRFSIIFSTIRCGWNKDFLGYFGIFRDFSGYFGIFHCFSLNEETRKKRSEIWVT